MIAVACPRSTAWCADHLPDADQCTSEAVKVAAHCYVWLLQELPGIEPTVVVDIGGSNDLTLAETAVLRRALVDLERLAS